MKIFKRFNKSKWIRVITFNSDKSSIVSYHKSINFNPSYIINPNHVFIAGGYRTIVVSDIATETINPLNFESKYPRSMFETAIESKLISETFNSVSKDKIDIIKLLLVANLGAVLILLYLFISESGLLS